MRLTRKLEPPYEIVLGEDYVYTSDTRLTKPFAQVEQKLGKYEDIDESPEHLAKIKKALEIIKDKRVDVSWLFKCFNFIENCSIEDELDYYNCNYEAYRNSKPLTLEEFLLLKEIML